MKRLNHLFEEIADYQNIRLAFLKAIRGKRSSPSVVFFCRNVAANLENIRRRLLAENIKWGAYRTFTITDPKLRTISAVPFEDRIMHHAIMNILEPVFERQFVFHTYACRKSKGTHAAVLYAFSKCKANAYFLKLDVRKYFDSIDHAVLKGQISRIIKDERVITILSGIIDSYHTAEGKGVPIGNLTSQFFANLYLSGMDHYVLEKLRPFGYARYMDDFVLWSNDRARLQEMLECVRQYAACALHLALKEPVLGKTTCGRSSGLKSMGLQSGGLPFLGFLIKESGIYLLQKSKKRMLARAKMICGDMARGLSEEKAQERLASVFAAVGLARTNFARYAILRGCRFRV